MSERVLMKGNEALAEAAIRAGCHHFFGYPITPQTELAAYMSKKMPKIGGTYLQAESEIAAINMVLGASSAGVRAMTSSSSPGISLKTEGISYIDGSDVPALIINVQRGGPGLGGIQPSQADYWQATKATGHGDFQILVFAPSTVQEMVDFVSLAFDLGDKYRMPAMILADGMLGQMMEPVTLPDFVEAERTPWALNGHYTYKKIGIFERDSMKEAVELVDKYNTIRENEQRWEDEGLEDADYVFVSYGVPGRSTLGAVRELRAQGEKVGIIRPITVWPFPEKAFYKINPNVKGIITVEANATGQLVDDAALYTKKALKERNVPAYALTYVFGKPTIRNIKKDYFEVKSGSKKEVY